MGLDMYLKKEITCESLRYDVEARIILTDAETGENTVYTTYHPSALMDNVAYWRKAYGIHDFIQRKVGRHIENCENLLVSREILQDLLTACKCVRENLSLLHEQFPVCKPYDSLDHYQRREAIEDLDIAISTLEPELQSSENGKLSIQYIYQACW